MQGVALREARTCQWCAHAVLPEAMHVLLLSSGSVVPYQPGVPALYQHTTVVLQGVQVLPYSPMSWRRRCTSVYPQVNGRIPGGIHAVPRVPVGALAGTRSKLCRGVCHLLADAFRLRVDLICPLGP